MTVPGPLTGPHGKYANGSLHPQTSVSGKATVVDELVNLNNFVKIAQDSFYPIQMVSGELRGVGAIRHRDKMMTDSFKASATIGDEHEGKTWIVTSATQNFDRFYAVQIESTLIGPAYISIVKGTSAVASTSTDLFGVVFGFIGFLLGLWADIIRAVFTAGQQLYDIDVADVISVWWDDEDSIVYAAINDVVVTQLAVPRHEIPHNEDSRYWGVVTGVGMPFPGAYFNALRCEDV